MPISSSALHDASSRAPLAPAISLPLPKPPLPVQPSSRLDEAQRFADKGLLVEAAQHCEEHLRTDGPSPEAYYLLGLICDATGDRSGAAEVYRKALHLDPKHYEALIHLALLCERQDDLAGDAILKKVADAIQRNCR